MLAGVWKIQQLRREYGRLCAPNTGSGKSLDAYDYRCDHILLFGFLSAYGKAFTSHEPEDVQTLIVQLNDLESALDQLIQAAGESPPAGPSGSGMRDMPRAADRTLLDSTRSMYGDTLVLDDDMHWLCDDLIHLADPALASGHDTEDRLWSLLVISLALRDDMSEEMADPVKRQGALSKLDKFVMVVLLDVLPAYKVVMTRHRRQDVEVVATQLATLHKAWIAVGIYTGAAYEGSPALPLWEYLPKAGQTSH